jgi:hypothetical protein
MPPSGSSRPPANPWAALELQPGASLADVKAAHRRLAKQWHPDLNKSPEAPERFKAIQEAYDYLTSPAAAQGTPAGPGAPAAEPGITLEDLFHGIRDFAQRMSQQGGAHVHEWVTNTSLLYGDRYQRCRTCGSSRDILTGTGAWAPPKQSPPDLNDLQSGTGL